MEPFLGLLILIAVFVAIAQFSKAIAQSNDALTRSNEALREIELDIKEGADAFIIKPALSYLDIISKAKSKYNIPIIAYNVSGEYSIVAAASQNKWINRIDTIYEILISMKRAGASAIITYHALEMAEKLNSNV